MTEHTPGPWVVLNETDVFEDIRSGGQVADCAFFTDFNMEICSANARLIAAAPDLLEACELVVEWANTDASGPLIEDVMSKVYTAIRAARGDDAT